MYTVPLTYVIIGRVASDDHASDDIAIRSLMSDSVINRPMSRLSVRAGSGIPAVQMLLSKAFFSFSVSPVRPTFSGPIMLQRRSGPGFALALEKGLPARERGAGSRGVGSRRSLG